MLSFFRLFLPLFAAVSVIVPYYHSQALEIDLDTHHLAVTTGFSGSQVILFGTVSDTGSLVIKVIGPPQQATIRKKERVLGVWANTQKIDFKTIPSFYSYAITKIPSLLSDHQNNSDLDAATYRRERIQVADLSFTFAKTQKDLDEAIKQEYQQALITLKTEQGLYTAMQGKITFISQELFRLVLTFPSTVPIGTYKLEVLHIQNGTTVHAKTTPLIVSKEGIGADIAYFAHKHSLLYGITTILLAVFAGWIAAAIFKIRG